MTIPIKIGIIGGSGLDDPDILLHVQEKTVTTPFGNPSDVLKIGKMNGVECVLLPRHGRKHNITPSMINYRANMFALKQEGCTHVLVTNACGSLRENIHPGDLVFVDSFIDKTFRRENTFFDCQPNSLRGVCHVPMDTAYCPITRHIFIDIAKDLGIPYHPKGTVVVVEGPRFSSKAESQMFRLTGGDVINMTAVPEVCLAKELGMCYAAIALPTDYDCWLDTEEPVSVELVLKTFNENAEKAKNVIREAVRRIPTRDWSHVLKDLQDAVTLSNMAKD